MAPRSPTTNLPRQISAFIGREAELRTVEHLLRDARLVTLTGAGGCGKTRLAIEVAAALVSERPDGVWWVDLAPLADPALVPSAAAAALGIRELPTETLVDTISRALGARRVLVVVDNCEHLIGAAAALTERLLQSCTGLAVLATSREPLGVHGEVTWQVPSLTGREAVRLFVDRATRVRPDFELTDANHAVVATICERLDGIALAIELAASRVRVLTPDQILDGLDDRFRLLTGGARSALPRQRTLEASVDWSYDLLSDEERIVLRRLGAFAGGFTLDAAEAVASGGTIDRPAVLDVLTALVDRSLVQVHEDGAVARYRLLETIRDYARRRLVDSGEAQAVSEAHLDHYAAVAAEAAPGLVGPDGAAWLQQLDIELDDLRRAIDWGLDSAEPDRAVRLTSDLHWYWRARSPREGRDRLRAAAKRTDVSEAGRGHALIGLAALTFMTGDIPTATIAANDALGIGRQLDDDGLTGQALSFLGLLAVLRADNPHDGPALLEEAVAAARAAGDHPYTALALTGLGFARAGTSRNANARQPVEQGIDLGRSIGYDRPWMEGQLWLGLLELVHGCFDAAATHLQSIVDVDPWRWDPFFRSLGHSLLGEVRVAQGRYTDARQQLALGIAWAREHRDAPGEAEVRRGLAWLAYVEGNPADAADEVARALGPLQVMDRREAARCIALRAHIELALGRLDEAEQAAAEGRRLGTAADYVRALAVAWEAEAVLARRAGESDTAEDAFHQMLAASQAAGHRPGICDALDGLAAAAGDRERFEEAARLHGAADTLRDALGYARFPVRHPDHHRDLARTIDALGRGAFRTAWKEGADLPLADAIAYARRRRGERKRPPHGWDSLTPSEQQIVALVTQGLTNPQIGERLFVSRRTVQSHLRHIFAKLGVATRAELAAKATRRSPATE